MDTLVLADTYHPLGRVEWQRAICWVLTGRVAVVEEYPDRVIHSPSQAFPMPSVVRFVRKVRGMFKRTATFNRRNIWIRDGGRCGYCGNSVKMAEFTFDHVTPRCLGGLTTWENIVVSCHPCNRQKADRTPEQAAMRLRVRPSRPTGFLGVYSPALFWEDGMPESWRSFLASVDYWHGTLEA